MKIAKKDRRDAGLYCKIKDSNKRWIEKEAKKNEMKLAEFVDAVFDSLRNKKRKTA